MYGIGTVFKGVRSEMHNEIIGFEGRKIKVAQYDKHHDDRIVYFTRKDMRSIEAMVRKGLVEIVLIRDEVA